MIPITGGGAFTNKNIADINANFSTVASVDVYVDSQNGSNSNNGLSAGAPKSTFAGLSRILEPGIRVGIRGVLFEEYSTPNIANVTVIGLGNKPLQGTTSGAPNGGGTTWLSPTSGTGNLVSLNGQGWTFQNIYFNNSATAAADVLITTAGDPPADADGAHATFVNCIFTGTDDGIKSTGLTNFVNIYGCTFFGFAGAGDNAIVCVTGGGIGTLWGWNIVGNRFYKNANNITAGFSSANISDNVLNHISNGTTTTTHIILTGGNDNLVWNNKFGLASDTASIDTMFIGGTNDSWGPNFYSDVTEYGVPAP